MAVKTWALPAPGSVNSGSVYLSPSDHFIKQNRRPRTMQSFNMSHASLKGIGIGQSPGKDFPPPDDAVVYRTKPLPAVPVSSRHSLSSSFSHEVNDAFETPKESMDSCRQDFRNWADEEAEIAAILDNSIKSVMAARRARPQIDTTMAEYNFPATPPGDLLCPQPRKPSSKILQLTGMPNPLASPSGPAPSGHNPPHKIRQLMGIDIGSDEYKWEPAPPVSPLTPASSIYSQDALDLDATISEPDESTCIPQQNDGYLSDSAGGPRPVSWASQPGYVPRSLHINKARKTSITSTHPPPGCALSPTPASHTKSISGLFIRFRDRPKPKTPRASHQPTPSSSSLDYHISAAEIAYATGVGLPQLHKSRPSTNSIGSSIGTGSASSSAGQRSSSSTQSAEVPPIPKDIRSNRSRSKLRRAPPPPRLSAVGGPPTFPGSTYTHDEALPVPYPPKSAFDEDDDDMESPSCSEAETPNRRRSMMERVFKKRHKSVGSTGSKNTSPWTSSVSHSRSRSGPEVPYRAVPEHFPKMSVTSAARPSSTSPPHGRHTDGSNAQNANRPGTAIPLAGGVGRSGFAQRTGDLMEQARAAMGVKSKDERRRDGLLRKGIHVLSEDYQLKIPPHAPPRPPRPLSFINGGEKINGNWL